MKKSKTTSQTTLKRQQAAKAEALISQLANANRLLVLCHMAEGEKTVGELAKMAELSHSALSQHLAKMRAAGLVTSQKHGKQVFYKLASMEAQAILSVLHLIYCRP